MNTPHLLPQVEQGRIVVNESTDLVEDHEEDGDVHTPCVRQGTIHIACSSTMLHINATVARRALSMLACKATKTKVINLHVLRCQQSVNRQQGVDATHCSRM